MTNKRFKDYILNLLKTMEYPQFVPRLMEHSPKKVISVLFSAILSKDEKVKWNAVAAFGDVVKKMCDDNIDDGKVFMRRLIWMLCDECGGIPWGVPEVMGEVLSKVDVLAKEYGSLLINQVIEYKGRADLFVEYEPLRRGAYWGVARFSTNYPHIVKKYLPELLNSFAMEKDLYIIALGLLLLQNLNVYWEGAKKFITINDCLAIFWDYKFNKFCINELAKSVLQN